MQLEQEKALRQVALANKQIRDNNKLAGATKALMKHRKGGKMLCKDWMFLILYILPKVGAEDCPSSYKTKGQLHERQSRLPEHWSTYIDVPNSDANSEKIQDNLSDSQPPKTTDSEPQDQNEELIMDQFI